MLRYRRLSTKIVGGTILAVRSPVLLILLPALLTAQSGRDCLKYEPTVVRVTGRLVQRVFPGPPNYENVETGDARETQWLVRLSNPVCVDGDPASELNTEAESGIKEIQLVITNSSDWKRYASLLRKDVRVTGMLFHAHTGHHRTPVLLTVRSIEGHQRNSGK
jgi:uncharacterized protein DUF4431